MLIDSTHEDISNPNKKYIKFQSTYKEKSNIKDKIEEEAELIILNESNKINS